MLQQIDLLIILHDLDLMFKEYSEKDFSEKAMGFRIKHLEELKQARKEIEEQIDPELYQRYERLNEKYGRPIAPVINGICYGCFIRMPTSIATQSDRNIKIITCENCGRFLYWVT